MRRSTEGIALLAVCMGLLWLRSAGLQLSARRRGDRVGEHTVARALVHAARALSRLCHTDRVRPLALSLSGNALLPSNQC